MKKIIYLLAAVTSLSVSAHEDTVSTGNKNYLSVELDPAPFMLNGYSVSVKFSPAKLPHYTFMGSVYSSRLPNSLISKSNQDKGWRNVRLKTSYAFFADYFLKENRKGFHFGASVFLYHKSAGLRESVVRTDFKSVYPNLRVGYLCKPFKKSGLYVNPWFNVGKEINTDRNNNLNGVTYSSDKLSYILAIHLGYQITF